MMARLYSNENFPLPVVEALRSMGHEGIIVCTDNPDFPALAAKVHTELQFKESLKGELVRVNRGA